MTDPYTFRIGRRSVARWRAGDAPTVARLTYQANRVAVKFRCVVTLLDGVTGETLYRTRAVRSRRATIPAWPPPAARAA